jgi:hypothetical protein
MHEQHEGQPPSHDTDQPTQLTDMTSVLGAEPTLVAGRYLLQRVIGEGGMAVVHEALDTRLDRQVAVKLLRDAAGDDTDRARFVSEARLLARLGHPGLVRVLDAGIDGRRPFLVLELVRGLTLSDALAGGLPEERVAGIGAQVAEALAHVHAAGIVHRDVKPGNVLLAGDGSARLTDFGIARLVDDTHHQTRTGMLVGTVAYLAPEQVAGETATTAVDIYAWGLVLLEALTGRRAYPGTSVESALARLHRRPDVPATLPRPWRTLLLAMTAPGPAARPTAEEVAARLRALPDVAALPVAPLAQVRRAAAPRPGLVLAGLGAAFALLVAVAASPTLSGLAGSTAGAASAHRSHQPAGAAAMAPATQAAQVAPAADAVVAAAPPTGQRSEDRSRGHARPDKHQARHKGRHHGGHAHKPPHKAHPKHGHGKHPGKHHGKHHGKHRGHGH